MPYDGKIELKMKVALVLCLCVILVFVSMIRHVTFMSKEDTCTYFKRDPDGYFAQLNQADLSARRSTSINQTILQSCMVTSDFTIWERLKLLHCCRLADIFFLRLQSQFPSIDMKQISDIPWILAKTNGTNYEEGLPHTRDNIIFVSNHTLASDILVQILVHEKVHIFERLYPTKMKEWMYQQGFQVVNVNSQMPTIRSNPDSDGKVYKDKHGVMMASLYTSSAPKCLRDVKTTGKGCPANEHPNESLAYYIDNIYGQRID